MTSRGYLRSEISLAIPKLNGGDIEWLIGLIDAETDQLRASETRLREGLRELAERMEKQSKNARENLETVGAPEKVYAQI